MQRRSQTSYRIDEYRNPLFSQIVPKSMLFGHDSAVSVLTNSTDSVEVQVILSASASGFVVGSSESETCILLFRLYIDKSSRGAQTMGPATLKRQLVDSTLA